MKYSNLLSELDASLKTKKRRYLTDSKKLLSYLVQNEDLFKNIFESLDPKNYFESIMIGEDFRKKSYDVFKDRNSKESLHFWCLISSGYHDFWKILSKLIRETK